MNSVIKGASYVLVHAPEMVLNNGTTQTTERVVNPSSEYLKELPSHLRSYEQVLSYVPNQVYIGNCRPDILNEMKLPFYDQPLEQAQRYGAFGEIMPEDEFLLLFQACDAFEVVLLEKTFVAATKEKLKEDPFIDSSILDRVLEGVSQEDIEAIMNEKHAEGLYHDGKLVGVVKPAHDIDQNLSAHVMFENLAQKASSVLALRHLLKVADVKAEDVDYVINCSEEACGDMNQRGGGNFAKSEAEIAGFQRATGSDTRSFCAGPSHAIIEAAALVSSGAYKTVVVTAGGCTAKLGMNGKDHVKKGMPVLEDCLAGFAILITENDGVSPEIDLNFLGRHTVGTGSAPQSVIGSLVADPCEKHNLKMTDIDKYAPELQNPDITVAAGAGDVPMANYKMIGALAVKKGHLDRKELQSFTAEHGMVGWAPTQGHIPSGVPYLGHAMYDLTEGSLERIMIIGKGSLFLGRMTNLFDGVSFVVHRNHGVQEKANTNGEVEGVSKDEVRALLAESLREFAQTLSGKAERGEAHE